MSCLFCRIAAGEEEHHQVWSDADHVAFLDTNPVTPGHVLLIPRHHVRWADELNPAAFVNLFTRVHRLMGPVAAAASAPHAGIVVEGGRWPMPRLEDLPA